LFFPLSRFCSDEFRYVAVPFQYAWIHVSHYSDNGNAWQKYSNFQMPISRWQGRREAERSADRKGDDFMNIGRIIKVLDKIPFVNLVPLFVKILSDFPGLWDKVPTRKKQELFNALIAAGTKAAVLYSGRDK